MRCLGSGAWARVLCLLLAALASYAVFTTWTREKKEKPRKSKGKTTGSVSTTTAGSTTTTGEPEEDGWACVDWIDRCYCYIRLYLKDLKVKQFGSRGSWACREVYVMSAYVTQQMAFQNHEQFSGDLF